MNNPLEYIINKLEERKAEILLEMQYNYFDDDFTCRQGEICYDHICEDDIIEKEGKLYYHEIDHETITWEAQDYILRTYQKFQNLINFLKQLEWNDFDSEMGAILTIERNLIPVASHKTVIHGYHNGDRCVREVSGESPHSTDDNEVERCFDMNSIDWKNLAKPKEKKK